MGPKFLTVAGVQGRGTPINKMEITAAIFLSGTESTSDPVVRAGSPSSRSLQLATLEFTMSLNNGVLSSTAVLSAHLKLLLVMVHGKLAYDGEVAFKRRWQIFTRNDVIVRGEPLLLHS